MPKVSVIIPVYNVEPWLRECLDSVVRQTLRDIEIICIDDGSTDRSFEILQKYAAAEPRMIVLRNPENRGQAYARNRAMDIAEGEYLFFVDSDDYITADALEKLYDTAVQLELDLLKPCLQVKWESDGYVDTRVFHPELAGKVYTGQELIYQARQAKQPHQDMVCTVIFLQTAFLRKNQITFYEGIYYEDVLFSFDCYACASRSMCVNDCLYIHRVRSGSTMTAPVSAKHTYSYTVLIERLFWNMQRKTVSDRFRFAAGATCCELLEEKFHYINKENLKLDTSSWEKSTAAMYSVLFREFIKRHSLIWENLDTLSCSRVFVYGAGKRAEKIFYALNSYDVSIAGVVVTEPSSSRKNIFGHAVQGIHDVLLDPETDVVLLAVSEKYQQEMLDVLHQKGIQKIFYC